ncbi:unnamed protein product, partial [Ectocarpus sp. 12 AP-2014]
MEVMLLRQNSIEHRLKVLFAEGDENGDGVLSFEEFNRIILRYDGWIPPTTADAAMNNLF